ncbi:MAG: bifunctional (p)ppGpp synthetase/guanosine-3',5'-bis(diphosphate) 3'-pyrophosphohydrolase [Chloroflexales bacterium]|nr:bifunctional (p)ppGpp synthetase/guanosine-3',5'-bis(diphosphate) 3'-pyrophosphohydrolase [Chloroflexales bacterium]
MDDTAHAAGGTPATASFTDPPRTLTRAKQAAPPPFELPTEPLSDALIEPLLVRLRKEQPDADVALVGRAYAVALKAHGGQARKSGEPYIIHPVAVATILLDLRLDAATIAGALLHDVAEDTSVGLDQIAQHFGPEIAQLVDGVTKLTVLEAQSKEEAQAGTYRKMFIAMADDPRVVLIKLGDRLHNMRTLGATSAEQQQRVARETIEIYAPLAHRLGIWQIKSELEDLSFKALNPEKYHEIARGLAMRKDARERIVQRVIGRLRATLEKEGISAQISGRPKHIYSIHRKMERKGVHLEEIYDQLAVRVMVNTVAECYQVLGVVHNIWPPVPGEFDDYIAMPKGSTYRSLHTTVLIPGGTPCEVQIRTFEMHDVAEHGIAAHWRYKEGFGRVDAGFEAKLTWLRSLIDWHKNLTAKEFVESLKTDVFEEQVYVFTPKGKIIDLPEGSTPIDFAFRIHSAVGNRAMGAKIGSKLVPLDYQLQNGDVINILTVKDPNRGPSRDWLNFVKTTSARNHIRRFFRRLERDDNIAAGRELLEKELKRLALTIAFDEVASIYGARNVDELLAAIGSGETTARTVVHKVAPRVIADPQDDNQIPQITPQPSKSDTTGVQVRGAGNVLTRLAKCCSPIEGEPIVGYVTRGKGITVHRDNCRTITSETDRNRIIEVTWGGPSPKGYPVPIRIESWDRVGLWRDVSSTIADAGINIEELQQVPTRKNDQTVLVACLTIQSMSQLTTIIDKLNRVPGVIEARRASDYVRAASS